MISWLSDRQIIGVMPETRPSSFRICQWLFTRLSSSFSLPGRGLYATMTILSMFKLFECIECLPNYRGVELMSSFDLNERFSASEKQSRRQLFLRLLNVNPKLPIIFIGMKWFRWQNMISFLVEYFSIRKTDKCISDVYLFFDDFFKADSSISLTHSRVTEISASLFFSISTES